MNELLRAFVAPAREPLQQWHPWVVHFPVVLLVLEAILLALFWKSKRPEFAIWSARSLTTALVTMLLAMAAGIYDSGLDLGEGNRFWLGVQDRWQNAFVLRSGVSVHVWFGLALLALTFARWLWRKYSANALHPPQALVFAAALLLNLWLLVAASHAGAVLNHK